MFCLTKIKSFYNFLKENPEHLDCLRKEAGGQSVLDENFLKETIVPFAKGHGFDVEFEDFLDYEKHIRSSNQEITDEMLENIAGGVKLQDVGKGLAIFTLLSGLSLGLTETTSFAASPSGKNTNVSNSQKADAVKEPKIISVTKDKIVMENLPGYEYNIMKDDFYTKIPWQRAFQDSGTFEDLEEFTEYKINVRNKKTLEYLGEPIIVKTFIDSKKIELSRCTFQCIYVKSKILEIEYSISRKGEKKTTEPRFHNIIPQYNPWNRGYYGDYIGFNIGVWDGSLDSNTEYEINARDIKTKQVVLSEPIVFKTKNNPYDTKILSISDNQIIIEPMDGYYYHLMEPENLSQRTNNYRTFPENGVFSGLKSNKEYVLGVSDIDSIRTIKTTSCLTENQKSKEKKLYKTNPEKPKTLSVTHNEIIMEDLPPEFVYKLQNFELETVTQSSGTFKNLRSDKEYWITVLSKDEIYNIGSGSKNVICYGPILIKTRKDPNAKPAPEGRKKIPMLLYNTYNEIVLETIPGYEYKASRTFSSHKKNDKNPDEHGYYTHTYEVPWQTSGVLNISNDPRDDDYDRRYFKIQIRDIKTGLIIDSIVVDISDDSQKPKIELLGFTHNRAWVRTLSDYEYHISPKYNRRYDRANIQNHGSFENLDSDTEYIISVYKKGGYPQNCITTVGLRTKMEPVN